MKVIICGAGEVGRSIAKYLALEDDDVTVIDQDPELVSLLAGSTDIKALAGHAALPSVLEQVGAAEADLLIAVTPSDEVNMMICQVAHSLFKVPARIARIREQGYLEERWSDMFRLDHIPITHVISPEIEVALSIAERMSVLGAADAFSLVSGMLKVINLRLGAACPVLKTPLKELNQLFPDLKITVMVIFRDGEIIVPTSGDIELEQDDLIYFSVPADRVSRALISFGFDVEEAPQILIAGGGNVGRRLALELVKHSSCRVSIIENRKDRSLEIATEFKGLPIDVFHGDVLDAEILLEAGAEKSQAIVTVTSDDEVNALACLLGKKMGIRHSLALVNRTGYDALLGNIGIDSVVMPRSITTSSILRHIRQGRILSTHMVGDNAGEILEGLVLETSQMAGKSIKELSLPKGILIATIVRNDHVVLPRGPFVFEADDYVVLYANQEVINFAEQLFSVSLEWF